MKRSLMFSLASRWGLALILLSALVVVPAEADLHGVAKGKAGFARGEHAPVYPLDTAPTMEWNTFMGGSSNDWGNGIAIDGSGNAHVAGFSYTTWGSPVDDYAGEQDGFVIKLDADGARLWNTFLGSASDDDASGIAVDGSGNVYVVGSSHATWGSPIREFKGALDGFVAKLNSSGALQWVTFLGGPTDDSGTSVAVDTDGSVYVVGTSADTWGTPINPYPGGWYAPYVAKLNSSGVLQWNTFWAAGGFDAGTGIAVDGSGDVYVVGDCYDDWGSPVDAYKGGSDACAVKLDTDGAREWNTFLGSNDSDEGSGIAVDGSGGVYVVGASHGTWGSPIDPYGGPEYDAFVARLNASDGVRQWNTFMGFSTMSFGNGITVDRTGSVYVTGKSKDMGAGVFNDAYLAKLDLDGFREWRVFMGAAYKHDYGSGVVSDGSGHIYVVGYSDKSWGSPVDSYSAERDAYVAKFAIPLQADVAIAKSAKPSVTGLGEVATYTLAFSNQGFRVATGVVITDAVPIALTNASYTSSGALITPTGTLSYTWEVQDLAYGAGGVITITGIVSPALGTGTFFRNTATIACATEDSDPDNNSSSAGMIIPSSRIFLPLSVKDY